MIIFLLVYVRFFFCPFIQQIIMEHLLRAERCSRDGCWPWASLYPREIPDQSDLTVNSNVLESVLRCGGVFFFFFFSRN